MATGATKNAGATNRRLDITSPSFSNNGNIPVMYSCDGANINPELNIGELPNQTQSLAIILEDPDSPKGNYVHWLMWNIPPGQKIAEASTDGVQGINSKQQDTYYGPCPPAGSQAHHYHFKIYALDTKLDLPVSSDKNALLKAMEGHVIASGELVGLYKK